MSRLQKGGLALCLQTGLTVLLVDYFGDGWNFHDEYIEDNWLIEYQEEVACDATGRLSNRMYQQGKYLMPLGDKQTQDELAKEKECELN